MAEVVEYEQINKEVKEWAKFQAQRMARLVGSLTLRDKIAVYKSVQNAAKNPKYKPLNTSISGWVKRELGAPARVNFKFQRHGVFMEHGVGRGRGIGSSGARPKPWLAPILDPAIQQLADIMASEYADITAGEIRFLIPGIIDRRIKINNG